MSQHCHSWLYPRQTRRSTLNYRRTRTASPLVQDHQASCVARTLYAFHSSTSVQSGKLTKQQPPLQRRPDIESAAQGSSYSERSSLNRKHSDDRVGNGHASPSPAPSSKRSSGRSGENEVLGFRILGKLEFWQLWAMMALLSGVGLMTIKYVSHAPLSRTMADQEKQRGERRQSVDPALEDRHPLLQHTGPRETARVHYFAGQLCRSARQR